MNLLAGAGGLKRVIREPTVNRPGLVLTGFTRYFAYKRVQAIGNAEAYYMKSLPTEGRGERYKTFFSWKIPCVVFSRNLAPDKLFLRAAEEAEVPIFRCPLVTMKFINLALDPAGQAKVFEVVGMSPSNPAATSLIPAKEQPYYHLLAENAESTYVAYVSQQNLVPDDSEEPVDHPAIAAMFDGLEGGRYHLRPEHRH